MMMRRRLTTVAVLLAALLVLGSASAQARTETVTFVRISEKDSPVDNALTGSGVTIVVLRASGEMDVPLGMGTISGKTLPLYDAVLITRFSNFNYGHSGPIQIGILTPESLSPGTRLGHVYADARQGCATEQNLTVSCGSPEAAFTYWKTWAEIIQQRNSNPLLFTTTNVMADDSLGVITGRQDEDGFAEVVVTNKGQQPTFATLLTDEPLEAADRIVDILQLDYDPETGIALYGGFLEY